MKAAILAVGTELLGRDRLDTNSLRITETLKRYGARLVEKAVVGDDETELVATLEGLCGRAALVVITGGLGPTRDDLTREAVSRLTGRELVCDPEIEAAIEARYRAMGREMPAVNLRQALVPSGAVVLDNDRGTAPGLRVEHQGTALFLFPGVPRELFAMLPRFLEPWLEERADDETRSETRELRVACMAESWVEEKIAPAYDELGVEAIAVLASPGEVKIRLTAKGSPEARRKQLDRGVRRLSSLVGAAVFTEEGEELEQVVGRLLTEQTATLSVAESCTGGWIGQRLTAIAGSSGYFVGGAISYSNELKTELLAVPPQLIETHGAVSAEVASAMATGARSRFATTYAVSVTGVAGPGGGTREKPVGTVCFGLAGSGLASSEGCYATTIRFPGDRTTIRQQSVQFALELVRRAASGTSLDIAAPLLPRAGKAADPVSTEAART